jgi:SAM-dependent methyltransferase
MTAGDVAHWTEAIDVDRSRSAGETHVSNVPTRENFESMYSGKAPWDIPGPQPELVRVADQIRGTVLDAGCGTGENALFLAANGHPVLGIDFLDYPIREAQRKARDRGLNAEFLRMDALSLNSLDRQFDSVIDSGLFHVFSDEHRARYVAGLAHVTVPGARLFLLCFSDQEPGTQGPRRISEQELRDAFKSGWSIDELRPARFDVVGGLDGVAFSEGGPRAWFALIRRQP